MEQPKQSLLARHPRFRWLTESFTAPWNVLELFRGAEVYRSWWWMRLYGGPSPKPHRAWSNTSWVAELWNGRLRGWKPSMNADSRPTVVYKDPHTGKKKWHGSRHLKTTQCWAEFMAPFISFLPSLFLFISFLLLRLLALKGLGIYATNICVNNGYFDEHEGVSLVSTGCRVLLKEGCWFAPILGSQRHDMNKNSDGSRTRQHWLPRF